MFVRSQLACHSQLWDFQSWKWQTRRPGVLGELACLVVIGKPKACFWESGVDEKPRLPQANAESERSLALSGPSDEPASSMANRGDVADEELEAPEWAHQQRHQQRAPKQKATTTGNAAPASVPKKGQGEGEGGAKKAKGPVPGLGVDGARGEGEKLLKKKEKKKKKKEAKSKGAEAGSAHEVQGRDVPIATQGTPKGPKARPSLAGATAVLVKAEDGEEDESRKNKGGKGTETLVGTAGTMGIPRPGVSSLPAVPAGAGQGEGPLRIAVTFPSPDTEPHSSSQPLLVRFPTGVPPVLRSTLTRQPGTSSGTTCQQPPLLLRLVGAAQAEQGAHQGAAGEREEGGSHGTADGRKGGARVLLAETPQAVYRSEPLAVSGAQKLAKPAGGSPAPRVPAGSRPSGLEASCQVLLGVFSRSTQQLQLLPLQQPTVVSLQCRIKGLNYESATLAGSGGEMDEVAAEPAHEALRSAADAAAAAAAQRRKALQEQALLTASFGSKAQRRRADSAARSRSIGDKEAGQALLAALPSLPTLPSPTAPSLNGVGARPGAAAPSAPARNLPPHDLTATSPGDAYPVSLLVPEEEWAATDPAPLLQAANEPKPVAFLKEAAKEGGGAYPQFVLSRLKHLTAVGVDAETRRTQARCMLHLTYLFRFLKAPPSLQWRLRTQGTKKESGEEEEEEEAQAPTASALAGGLPTLESIAQNLPAPLATTARLVRTFAEVVGGRDPGTLVYRRPAGMRDLLIEHILVLGLHVDAFDLRMSTRQCAADFQLMPKQLVQYLRELGAKVVRLKVVTSGPDGAGAGAKRKRGEDEGAKGKVEDREELYRVTLPVPLRFPELKRRRQAKKKD